MKNSSEAKFYPNSNHTRLLALNHAKALNDILLVNNPLSQRTKDRLNAIQLLYSEAHKQLLWKKADYFKLMTGKEKLKTETAMYCAHFIMVFDLCVRRGEYSIAQRVYYGLPETGDALPDLKRQSDITTVAKNIISGEASRVAAGGVPMSRPSAAEVEDKYKQYQQLINDGSNAKEALIAAQQVIKGLKKEANGVIKKVWSEVQTFYDELPRESMREHGRHWGITYARKGNTVTVSGTVTDAATGLPLAGVTIQFLKGRNKVTTNSEGKFSISTTLMHEQIIVAQLTAYETTETKLSLNKKTVGCDIKMMAV